MELSADFFSGKTFSLRIIPFKKYDGFTNMALDAWFAEKNMQPDQMVLRFYGWQPFCISLGYHQSVKVLDINAVRKDNLEWIRRPTGGRAIFHAEELTYSIVMSRMSTHPAQLYRFMHEVFTRALNGIGIAVQLTDDNRPLPGIRQQATDFPCFSYSAKTEVQFEGKKVIGSAQKIYDKNILQHGSILLGVKHEQLVNYLKTDAHARQKILHGLKNKTVCLNKLISPGLTPVTVQQPIIKQLELIKSFLLNYEPLSDDELAAARAAAPDKLRAII